MLLNMWHKLPLERNQKKRVEGLYNSHLCQRLIKKSKNQCLFLIANAKHSSELPFSLCHLDLVCVALCENLQYMHVSWKTMVRRSREGS